LLGDLLLFSASGGTEGVSLWGLSAVAGSTGQTAGSTAPGSTAPGSTAPAVLAATGFDSSGLLPIGIAVFGLGVFLLIWRRKLLGQSSGN
jgi:hypothetical protein